MEGGDLDPNGNGTGAEVNAGAAVHARFNRRCLERVTICLAGDFRQRYSAGRGPTERACRDESSSFKGQHC